jgi:hypothetical protein
VWRTSPAGNFFIALLSVTALWAWMAIGAARQFCVSGVVAQWYYAPAGVAPQDALSATVRHALGPQSGTVAFAGAVLAAVQALRQAANSSLRTEGRDGIGAAVAAVLCCIARCAANLVLSIVEFLCRYSLIWSALTGQSLVDSGGLVRGKRRRGCYSGRYLGLLETP